jgi:hypothetical protein
MQEFKILAMSRGFTHDEIETFFSACDIVDGTDKCKGNWYLFFSDDEKYCGVDKVNSNKYVGTIWDGMCKFLGKDPLPNKAPSEKAPSEKAPPRIKEKRPLGRPRKYACSRCKDRDGGCEECNEHYVAQGKQRKETATERLEKRLAQQEKELDALRARLGLNKGGGDQEAQEEKSKEPGELSEVNAECTESQSHTESSQMVEGDVGKQIQRVSLEEFKWEYLMNEEWFGLTEEQAEQALKCSEFKLGGAAMGNWTASIKMPDGTTLKCRGMRGRSPSTPTIIDGVRRMLELPLL